MEPESFLGGDNPHQHLHVCCCGGASLQDIRVMFKEEFGDVNKRFEDLDKKFEEFVKRFEDAVRELNLPRVLPEKDDSLASISRSLAHQAESSASKRLFLCINDESLPETLFTLNRIKDQVDPDQVNSLTVELLDEFGSRVEDGPESSAKIGFVVLNGDSEVEDNDWTEEDISRNIVLPRKDKPPVLKGKCEISLSRGFASFGDFSFTDNSKRSGSVRLAAQAVKAPRGVDIRTAVSRDFKVKERRLLCDKKIHRPSPGDALWRLKNISRVGQLYGRAKKAGIFTVGDFLQQYHTHPEKMRDILKVSSAAKWKEIVENAEACELGNELYRYYDNTTGAELHLDLAFNIVGLALRGQFSQLEYFNYDQKHFANDLRSAAYEKRSELKAYNPTNQMQIQAALPWSSNLPSMNMQQITVTAEQAFSTGGPIQHINTYTTPLHFDHDGGQLPLPRCFQRNDSPSIDQYLNYPTSDIVQLGETFDLPEENTPPSKVKAIYYVTKAAHMFMVSIQQGQSPSNKKRKLQ